jgi:N-acetylglucosamine kinase-like BadF-type ATPase
MAILCYDRQWEEVRMRTVVVGVDGGTTKTVALVADEQGRVVGAARGAGSNWAGIDVEIPMAVVVATV